MPAIFIIIIILFVGLGYFLQSAGKEDPCVGIESSFRAWCDSCSIKNWPATDGASETLLKCMQKRYNKNVSTCDVSRSACTELANVG